MKLAVRTSIGEIILIGESVERMRRYIRVNPMACIVMKTRGDKWLEVEII